MNRRSFAKSLLALLVLPLARKAKAEPMRNVRAHAPADNSLIICSSHALYFLVPDDFQEIARAKEREGVVLAFRGVPVQRCDSFIAIEESARSLLPRS